MDPRARLHANLLAGGIASWSTRRTLGCWASFALEQFPPFPRCLPAATRRCSSLSLLDFLLVERVDATSECFPIDFVPAREISQRLAPVGAPADSSDVDVRQFAFRRHARILL